MDVPLVDIYTLYISLTLAISIEDKSRLAGFQVVDKTMGTTEIKQLAASCYTTTVDTLVDIGALKDNERVEITTSLLCDGRSLARVFVIR